jgi:protein-S-isoprenylcysteine O-methyltransferase Ste14
VLIRLVALLCCLVALAGSAALAVRVFALGLDRPTPHVSLPGPPLWIDLGWLLLFGVQHSIMARDGFNRAWLRVVPARLERSVYAACSGVLLLALAAAWQPLPGPPWWSGPWWLSGVAVAGALGLSAVNLAYDHAGLFGLRQAWEESPTEDRLQITGPYRFVRHPLMACLLVVLWGHAVMPPTLALLAGGLSVYIFLGLAFEERDLLRRFGPAYSDYRRRVPALVPWRRPHPGDQLCPAPAPGSSTPSAR